MTKPSDRLFNRNFTLFFAGQSAAFFGSTLYYVVLVLYLKKITGSATIIGVVELLAFLPWVLLGPFAGTLVDKTSRKTVIIWSYFLRSILMVLLFIFSLDYFFGLKMIDIGVAQFHFSSSFPFTLYIVFCVTLCMGIIDSAFNAALYSIIPLILKIDKIQKGNSLLQGSSGLLAMIGNALGGVFFSAFGGTLAFLLNGITYLSAAFSSLFITLEQKDSEKRYSTSYRSFIKDVKEGLLFIWANKGLRNQTIVYTLSNLFFPAVMIMLPFLVEDVMKLGEAYYGYLLSILTMSSIAGYFVYGMLKTTEKQNYIVICGVFILEAILFLFLSFSMNVYLVFGLLSLISVCMAVSRLINTSIKQKVIPEELRGRVFGTLDSINGGLVPLSLAGSGIVIDLLNKNILLIFFFIFIIYSVLALFFVLSRPIKNFYLQKV